MNEDLLVQPPQPTIEIDIDAAAAEQDDTAEDARLVPPPTDPMPLARTFARSVYTTAEGLALRCWRGDLYQHEGTHWEEIQRPDIRKVTYEWLESAAYLKDGATVPFQPTPGKVDSCIDALKAVVGIPSRTEVPSWIGAILEPIATDIVSVKNGLLHMPTRTLLPHTSLFFNHHSLPFAYDPGAPEPARFLNFTRQLWPDDQSSIDALQEMFGLILAGGTRYQKMFLVCGPKRGGKGTIARVLSGLVGKHNVAAPTLASLSTNFGVAPLIGKPLAVVSDARLSRRTDGQIVVERLLSISGEDSITVDRKYRDAWTGRLPTRFVILTNELPKLSDSSGALASRFIPFVLTKSFYGRENLSLTEELLSEASSIFNWSLAGLDRLTERGHFVIPEAGKEAIQQLEELSSPIGAFVRTECVIVPTATVLVERLWQAWQAWCEREHQHHGSKEVFARDLRAAVPTLKRSKPHDAGGDRAPMYVGIGLRTDTPGPGGPGSRHEDSGRAPHAGPGGPGNTSKVFVDAEILGWDGPDGWRKA